MRNHKYFMLLAVVTACIAGILLLAKGVSPAASQSKQKADMARTSNTNNSKTNIASLSGSVSADWKTEKTAIYKESDKVMEELKKLPEFKDIAAKNAPQALLNRFGAKVNEKVANNLGIPVKDVIKAIDELIAENNKTSAKRK
ncbi:MAG: hypothetical protein NTU54_02025 [Candidatus Omnitrophica bacterium]|nr:hypothetical protein [Candidatus Omnitrophota bacterium]